MATNVQLGQSQNLRQKGYQLDEQLAGKRLQELDNHSPLRAARRKLTKSTTRKRSPGPEAMGNYGSVSIASQGALVVNVDRPLPVMAY